MAKTVQAQKTAAKPLALTKRLEEILKTIHYYRYMTALDVTNLLYSPASLTYVRALLSELAGGGDDQPREYLYRFRLPGDSAGHRVYTLGSRGRDFLARELGLPVEWYFRPYKVGHMSYSQMMHNLVLTRFLVCANVWARKQLNFRLAETRISYELAKESRTVKLESDKKTETLTVIPDAWLLFERIADGKHDGWYPVLLEIDRGTAHGQKFKQHVAGRIEFVRGGAYNELFGIDAVMIAYATTGATPGYAQTRRQAMSAWTKEVLAQLHSENWASLFRFHALAWEELTGTTLFEEPVWYRPDSPSPLPLFG